MPFKIVLRYKISLRYKFAIELCFVGLLGLFYKALFIYNLVLSRIRGEYSLGA